eukprot:TRINITY_DN22256_c0_g1_i1.p1 TRINITY_DN22256_c0_g1~~TRINITY_DN22256_c0_g1_i1.p1  ORF type:complete len:441 (+),score=88.71 TRINITY_DN22256_c0_g1_i1:28-1323(+)
MKRGKKDAAATKKEEKKMAKQSNAAAKEVDGPLPFLIRCGVCAFLCLLGILFAASGSCYSEVEQRMSIVPRLIFFFVTQASMTEILTLLGLQIARRICGENGFATWAATDKEMEVNDTRIQWPASELLSEELKAAAVSVRRGERQPFFLNHVTGRQRLKDTSIRIAMAVAALACVWYMCYCMDGRELTSLGLTLDRPFFVDMFFGLLVGVAIVMFMFGVELAAGWVIFLQFFEVFDKSERFSLCILLDVLFHIAVAINEELPVRGWMLYNLAEASVRHLQLTPTSGFLVAMILQSAFFVAMHLPSPGGTRPLSMLNIFVGGMAGGLNVLFTGGRLGFVLGWHFGWNISMGNIFGRSTSGIPISATFISVAPHPEKEDLHGGVFGPEGGVISPAAYLLGIVFLAWIYGVPDSTASASIFVGIEGVNMTNSTL